MSVAFVVRAWTSPKVCGLMSSGAIPQNNLPVATSDQLAGSESAKAEPRPPRRATPLLSTKMFLWKRVNTQAGAREGTTNLFDVAVDNIQAVHVFQRTGDLCDLGGRGLNKGPVVNATKTLLTSFSLLTFGCWARYW